MAKASTNINTISDKSYADLSRRAQKAPQASVFSPAAVAHRKQSEAQRGKADQS